MKYHKFEIVKRGEQPIIRVTYKTFWGKLKEKDVCTRNGFGSFWVFMEDGGLVFNDESINAFYKSGFDSYIVNTDNKRQYQ